MSLNLINFFYQVAYKYKHKILILHQVRLKTKLTQKGKGTELEQKKTKKNEENLFTSSKYEQLLITSFDNVFFKLSF